MVSDELARYQASDGTEITLSLASVTQALLPSGDAVSEREIMRFIALCQARKLNPFAGDCYLMPNKGRAVVIVSKDFYLRTAAMQPTFDGFDAGVIVATKTGELVYRAGALVGTSTEKLVGGWACVYDSRRHHPIRAEVSLTEYRGASGSLWDTKPATMIRKVALVQALREAYPAAYAGLYDEVEVER